MFVVLMALRELRSSWRRLIVFFVCIAIGVGSIVTLRSVIQSVRNGLAHESRTMLSADLVISSNDPFTEGVLHRVAVEEGNGRISQKIETIELPTMVRPADKSRDIARIVELRAVPPEFPLYGSVELEDGSYSHASMRDRGVLVKPELLAQLNMDIGESLLIGNETFTIRGVISSEPGRDIGAFSLGSRVMINVVDLSTTGLLSFGSRVSYQLLLRVPAPLVDELLADLQEAFANEFVRIRSYRRADNRIGENFQQAENYLSLTGLVILILGGIGVSSATRVFIHQKIKSVAILKCVGATTRQILAVYIGQILLLGIAGSLLGVIFAGFVVEMIPLLVGEVAQFIEIDYGLTLSAVLQGASVGLAVSLIFALVPLLALRHIKPSVLLRQGALAKNRIDLVRLAATTAAVFMLMLVVTWQAGSFQVAFVLISGLLVVAGLLYTAGVILVRVVQPLRHARSFALRHAVRHIARSGSQTGVVLLAVGLGTFFLLSVWSLQENLVKNFSMQVEEGAPDMFLLDVQKDQREDLAQFIKNFNGNDSTLTLIPVLRARVVAVRGQEVNLDSFEDVRGRGSLSREYTVTYRSSLEGNEQVSGGTWWDSTPTEEVEVSIEESLQERFGIQSGDQMTFNILGRDVTALVSSIRKVDWGDFRAGGFMFVFRPGPFEELPHTYISTAHGPSDVKARAELVSGLARQFSNISVIDLREVLVTVRNVIESVTIGVTTVGVVVLLSGILILVGAVSMTKFQRIYESAILRTLGGRAKLIATILLLEYGVVGIIAGVIGAIGAMGFSWAVAYFIFEMSWVLNPILSISGIALVAIIVAVTGVVASADVLRHKPLVTLRAE